MNDQIVPHVRHCDAGESWVWNDIVRFRFLSPAADARLSRNDGSCVLQVTFGESSLLLTGDIEREQESELTRYWGESLRSSWLLVAHHGSNTSSYRTMLKYVQPEAVVISSGYANQFGHPHPDAMERLSATGAVVYRTASQGALEFEFPQLGEPQVNAYREQYRKYWH